MSLHRTEDTRVVAIDPTWHGFGVAVFEGPSKLIDWGEKKIHGTRVRNEILRKIKRIIEYYRPDVIVVEDCAHRLSRRGPNAREFIRRILCLAAEMGVKTRRVPVAAVHQAFSQDGRATKYEIAVALTELFPELEVYLPPKRRAWMSEDPRMAIFDAVALALTALGFRLPSD